MRERICLFFLGAGLAALAALGTAAAQERHYGLVVINNTGTIIEYFYIAECEANEWGRDRLGAREVIQPGARRHFDMRIGIPHCCRDMRAKLVTGAARQRLGVDVCRETQWVVR